MFFAILKWRHTVSLYLIQFFLFVVRNELGWDQVEGEGGCRATVYLKKYNILWLRLIKKLTFTSCFITFNFSYFLLFNFLFLFKNFLFFRMIKCFNIVINYLLLYIAMGEFYFYFTRKYQGKTWIIKFVQRKKSYIK